MSRHHDRRGDVLAAEEGVLGIGEGDVDVGPLAEDGQALGEPDHLEGPTTDGQHLPHREAGGGVDGRLAGGLDRAPVGDRRRTEAAGDDPEHVGVERRRALDRLRERDHRRGVGHPVDVDEHVGQTGIDRRHRVNGPGTPSATTKESAPVASTVRRTSSSRCSTMPLSSTVRPSTSAAAMPR